MLFRCRSHLVNTYHGLVFGRPAKARLFGHPIHAILVPIPVVCFVGALLTDIVYARSADIQWSNFSAWLLAFGILFGVLAAIAGLVDFIGRPQIRSHRIAWVHMIGNAIVLVLASFNNLVHTHDAWTSVVPTGLILSIVTVLVLLVTGWLGQSMVYRHGIGVQTERGR